MECRQQGVWFLVAILALSGCGGPADNAPVADAAKNGPTQIVHKFLEAVRTGDDVAATALLSPLAQKKLKTSDRPLTPPASDTASFEVGEMTELSAKEVRVACTWTDLDPEGTPQTDQADWTLRCEPEGWRIVGVAYQVFDDAPALVLNFEDPEDMARQQEWVVEEDRRRAIQAQLQAQTGENFPESIRR